MVTLAVMTSSLGNDEEKVIRVFSNYEIGKIEQGRFLNCSNPNCRRLRFDFNKSGKADLILVLNFAKVPRFVLAPKGRIVKILQEPVVQSYWTHRFTFRHSKLYSSIRAHSAAGAVDPRVVLDHPHLPMHVDACDEPSEKSELVSVIASKLAILPGHKNRDFAVSGWLEKFPEYLPHAYGRGRKQIDHKEEGLAPYLYSIAIENDVSQRYFTEKILDCFEQETVPLYYGAPDILDFFPKESIIKIETLDPAGIAMAVERCSAEDWAVRRLALLEAKALARTYSRLCCLATELLANYAPQAAQKRIVLVMTLDTILTFIRRSGIGLLNSVGLLGPAQRLISAIRNHRDRNQNSGQNPNSPGF